MTVASRLDFYLFVHVPDTVFTGRVNGTPADPYVSIPFDAGVTGSFGLPLDGMSVWFGSTSGGQERGVMRQRAISGVSSGTLQVNEDDEVGPRIQNNDFITIKAEFRCWPRFPRFLQQGQNVTIFEDYGIAYTNQTNQWRPKAVAGPPGAGFLEGGQAQISFVGNQSAAIAQGASITSYLWTARGSVEGTSTSQGTPVSPVVFTWTNPGRYLVTLEVENSNGNTDIQHTWAYVENPDNPSISFTDFDTPGDNYDFAQGGGEASFTVEGDAGIDQFPAEAMVLMVARGDIATATGSWPHRTNVLFCGWILSDSIRQDPVSGDVSFRAGTIDAVMKNTKMFPPSLTDTNSPTTWTQARRLTADRAIHYLYLYRSTVGLMTPVVYSGYNQLVYRQDFGPGNLYNEIQNNVMRSLFNGRLVSTHQSVLYHVIDYNVQTTSERAAATTRKTLHKGVWVNQVGIEERHNYSQPVNQVKMSGVFYPGGGIQSDICPLFSEAPGDAPAPYGNESSFDNMIIASQGDLDIRCGLMYAKLRKRYEPYRMQFINDGSFTLAPQELFPANIEATDNDRELAFSGNLIPRRISRQYDHRGGYFTVSVDFEPETTGPAGTTVDMPCGPPDQELPPGQAPDPPAALPGLTSLIAGTTGTSFYFAPGIAQTWQRRVNGLVDPDQLGFLDILPDPWSNFKQGYNPDGVIVWGAGRGFLARSTDSGQSWRDRTGYLSAPAWPGEVGPALADVDLRRLQGDIFSEDRLYVLAGWQYTGAYHGAIYKSLDGFTYTAHNLTGTSEQVRPLGMSVDRGNGSKLYVTTWENNVTGLYLRQYNTSDMSLQARYELGQVTAADVDANLYYASPFNRNGEALEVFIYGQMFAPQGFTGNVQILQNTDCGQTGSYAVKENTLSSLLGSFGADADDYYYAVQNNSGGGPTLDVDETEVIGDSDVNNVFWDTCKATGAKAVIIYTDGTDIKAVAIDTAGGSVDIGAAVTLHSTYSVGMSVAYLEDNKVIAAYHDNSNDNIYARVLTLTGLTIAQGTEATIKTNSDANVVVEAVSNTKAVVLYKDIDGYGKVIDISGTTIDSIGAETSFAPNLNGNLEAVAIGSRILTTYASDSSNVLEAVLIYNIDTDFDATSEEVLAAYNTGRPASMVAISDTEAVVAYNSTPTSSGIRARKISGAGDILTVYAADTYTRTISTNASLGVVCNTSGGLVGFAQQSPAAGLTINISISGNNVLFGSTETQWDDIGGNTWYYRGVNLTTTSFLFFASDGNMYVLGAVNELAAKFHHGLGALSEKFTLPFAAVRPGAFTLDQSLGTVVMASDAPTAQPVIYSTGPNYVTGTATSDGFPTGSSVQALKWI